MAFTFSSPTLSGHIDEYDLILFDMIQILRLDLPLLAFLQKQFYESPVIAKDKVGSLREEALAAMRGFVASGTDSPSVFKRALELQTPYFREIATGLRPWDPERCLGTLVAVCDDALAHDAPVKCFSD